MTTVHIWKKNSSPQRDHSSLEDLTKLLFVLAEMGYYLQLVAFIVHLSKPYILYCDSVSIWALSKAQMQDWPAVTSPQPSLKRDLILQPDEFDKGGLCKRYSQAQHISKVILKDVFLIKRPTIINISLGF